MAESSEPVPPELQLQKAREREQVLAALVAAVTDWRRVGDVLESAANDASAREALQGAFRMSEIQATAVMDMQWRRLTATNHARLKRELDELRDLIADLEAGM